MYNFSAGLLPHLRSASQAQRLNQKRPYSSPSTEPYAAVVDAPGVAVDNAESSRMAQHLNGLFSPLQFPHELAARILTHSSYRDWRVPHNARLSFVGAFHQHSGLYKAHGSCRIAQVAVYSTAIFSCSLILLLHSILKITTSTSFLSAHWIRIRWGSLWHRNGILAE